MMADAQEKKTYAPAASSSLANGWPSQKNCSRPARCGSSSQISGGFGVGRRPSLASALRPASSHPFGRCSLTLGTAGLSAVNPPSLAGCQPPTFCKVFSAPAFAFALSSSPPFPRRLGRFACGDARYPSPRIPARLGRSLFSPAPSAKNRRPLGGRFYASLPFRSPIGSLTVAI